MKKWRQNMECSKGNNFPHRRTNMETVAQYYTSYVETMGISNHFRNYTVVTGVKEIQQEDSSNSCLKNIQKNIDIHENHIKTCEEVFTLDINDFVPAELSSYCRSQIQMRSISSISSHSSASPGSLGSQSSFEIHLQT